MRFLLKRKNFYTEAVQRAVSIELNIPLTSNFNITVMSEDLIISKGDKTQQYKSLLPQIKGLLDGEPDLIANLANVTASLKEQFRWLWVGFYLVKKDELVL